MKSTIPAIPLCTFALIAGLGLAPGCARSSGPVVDEAKAANKTPDDFPTHAYDAFAGMDGGIDLSADEIKGRNTWLMWTAGNDAFWDYLARHSLGLVDLLKLLDNRFIPRAERFARLGLIPEPGMRPSTPAEADERFHGLQLDVRDGPEPEYPPDPEVYGYSSGIMGLRLFPNPAFDSKARTEWDPAKFEQDQNYYKRPDLVRPFRVGVACAFCHVSYHPLFPPDDVNAPEMRNLSATIGSQYFRAGRVFGYDMDESSLVYHILNSARPGTLDTSLIATDGLNNPNSMNAVFDVPTRLAIAQKIAPERVSEAAMAMGTFEELGFPSGAERQVPHILVGGSDSIGTKGALCRVFVNIGEYHEEWIRTHNLMIGFKAQRPFEITAAVANSVFWQVTERRSTNLAKYFLRATGPMRLEDARWTDDDGTEHEGSERIDADVVERGAQVFADECFTCHSSKQPDGFWDDPTNVARWSADADYAAFASEMVGQPDFRDGNYFSTDQRYPVTLIGTNATRSLADNGMAGRVWDNFTSETFKNQPPIGTIRVQHPYDSERTIDWDTAGAGPGRYRPHTLIGIWATAPFLHNNSVGAYPASHDPARGEAADVSVEGRLTVFERSIEELLWPEKRAGYASIYRTTRDSSILLPRAVLPDLLMVPRPVLLALLGLMALVGVWIFLRGRRRIKAGSGSAFRNIGAVVIGLGLVGVAWFLRTVDELELGHIPAGTPINLLANLNGPGTLDDPAKVKLLKKIALGLLRVDEDTASLEDVPGLVENLLALNKCPDFVLDRGHTFGSQLSDEDKRALIEFLKTL